MRSKDVIFLIGESIDYDDLGNPIATKDERKVYANRFHVGQNEFYNASQQGLKPEKEFEIYTFEYSGESELKHQGKTYEIIRVAEKGEKTRIVCQKVAGS